MLNVAYIGFGTSVVRYHLPYVKLRPEIVNVRYIYQQEEFRVRDKERELLYPDIEFTSDLEAVLNDESINLVTICSPNETHYEYAMKALQHGKNVLIEKPIALSVGQAKEILEYAKEHNLIAMPNHNRRFDTDMLSVKEAVESGKLGRIIELESHYDYFRSRSLSLTGGLAVLLGLGIHTTDQIVSLFGKPERLVYDVRSLFYESGADDYYDIDFFYDNFKAIMKTSMKVKIPYPRFTVHGDKGSFVKYGGAHNSSQKLVEPFEVSLEVEEKEFWGRMEYVNDTGESVTEYIPSKPTDYGRIYDALHESIINGAPKLVTDEEVITDMEIICEAMEAVK